MMTCPLRDECWREALACDGSGARVREVPASVTRPTPCNFERLNLVGGCPRARQRGGTAATPTAAPMTLTAAPAAAYA